MLVVLYSLMMHHKTLLLISKFSVRTIAARSTLRLSGTHCCIVEYIVKRSCGTNTHEKWYQLVMWYPWKESHSFLGFLMYLSGHAISVLDWIPGVHSTGNLITNFIVFVLFSPHDFHFQIILIGHIIFGTVSKDKITAYNNAVIWLADWSHVKNVNTVLSIWCW